MATNNSCNYNPTQYDIQCGGGNGLLHDVSVGTIGQFLNSNGTGNYPSFKSLPAFSAKVNSAQNNVTGDGTGFLVPFTNVLFNIGSNFDGTSTFTAPVTGIYEFGFNLTLTGVAVAHTFATFNMAVTGDGTSSPQVNIGVLATTTGTQVNLPFSNLVTLAAGGTMTLTVAVSGSTKTVNVVSGNLWGHMIQQTA
jgi:hypothetical protein